MDLSWMFIAEGVFMTRFDQILVQSANGVKTITLNRPEKRNALSPRMIEELTVAFDEAESCACGVVILTGAGSAFCAGLDMEHLESLRAHTPEEHRRDSENMARVLRALYDFPKPVIAAVNGPAIAGGMILATIPDFTLATQESKFGFNEVRVGFVPAIAASFLLRQVGEKRSRELLLTGRLLKAQEALQMGLVTQVVAAEELMQTAHALAQTLLQNSPQAMQAVKRLLARHARRRLDEEIEDAIEVNAQQRSTEDFKEGVQAFLQHRKPAWPSLKGRG
ncbi:MAG: enoyl-CoA hydratase/isomerase family protein [Terracidiphilus sp.]